jgi:hypothetical protein
MSLLSQFFPSGSGASTSKIKTNMLMVAGGAGGTPAGGQVCTPNESLNSASGGGGGGAGEVIELRNYEFTSGSTLTVTVGSGGGASSNGGNSCVTSSLDNDVYVMVGGNSSSIPDVTSPVPCSQCARIIYSSIDMSIGGGGGGATGFVCRVPTPCPGVSCPTVGGNNQCVPTSKIYCGLNGAPFNPCPACVSSCIIDYFDRGTSIRPLFGSGGASSFRLAPNTPGMVTASPTYCFYPGLGGGGGAGAGGNGGSISVSSGCGAPPGGSTAIPASITCFKSPDGGIGGCGIQTEILGSIQCFASGGGGGGGNVTQVFTLYSCVGPACCQCFYPSECYRGLGGTSCSGGCGGKGGVSARPPFAGGSGCVYAPYWVQYTTGCNGCNATVNTGGGGGGGGAGPTTQGTAGSGGSGVVIIQYSTFYPAAPAFPGACDCSPSTPGCRTYKFNGPGSITLP